MNLKVLLRVSRSPEIIEVEFENKSKIKFNEEVSIGSDFSSSLQYPSFFALRNSYFNVNQNILNNINSTIYSDVFTFKNGVIDEEIQVNADNNASGQPSAKYRVVTNDANTFNKNNILSTIVSLMAFVNNEGPKYNELNIKYPLVGINDMDKEKMSGTNRRGKRTIAKEKTGKKNVITNKEEVVNRVKAEARKIAQETGTFYDVKEPEEE